MDALLELAANNNLEQVQSEKWWLQLVESVEHLLEHDFNALIQILYRLDVSEDKIRKALEQNMDTSASILISKIILDRQIKKLHDRKQFSTPKPDSNDDLSW